MAKIVVHRRAQKYLERMDARIKAQLIAKLEALARNPESASNVKPMEGDFAGFYRMRHGDLRVIYQWDKAQDTIVISHIGPRGDIYKLFLFQHHVRTSAHSRRGHEFLGINQIDLIRLV